MKKLSYFFIKIKEKSKINKNFESLYEQVKNIGSYAKYPIDFSSSNKVKKGIIKDIKKNN